MAGGIDHDSDGVLCLGEVMTREGIVSMVQWRHPDGRRFSATGDSLTTAMAMAVQMEKDRVEAECVVFVTPSVSFKVIDPSTCPKCGAVLLVSEDGTVCMRCPHLETRP